jgi:hypothetical protein
MMTPRGKGAQLQAADRLGVTQRPAHVSIPSYNQKPRTSDEARLPGRGLHNVGA